MQKINLENKVILITGASGFIGANLAQRLLNDYKDIKIIGLDSMNDYYDTKIKEYRLNNLLKYPNFKFVKAI